MMKYHMQFVVMVLPCLFAAPAFAAEKRFDVVVYGGTSGGISAAVQTARMGKRVALIEPTHHLGGLTTGGLGATDIGNKHVIGGISRQFYQLIRKHYEDEANWTRERRADFRGRGHEPNEDAAWTFEPHVAERVYESMVDHPLITVVRGRQLDRARGVKKQGERITAIVMEGGDTYAARVFIDATYEGDLMAAAAVSYHVGREANRMYGETLNGVQVRNATKHQFTHRVDPYVKPGDPSSGLLPGVHDDDPGEDGTGDHRVQAYNFRLCATDDPANRRPWPKPANYDPLRYELLLRNFEAGDHRVPWNPVLMPNRKTDSNNNFAISTDNIGYNYAYPDADYAARDRIIAEHRDYQMGLMWTLANDRRVPEPVRRHFQTWGLAKDEFTDSEHWPRQLYVREARRMVGAYVMTEHNCRRTVVAEDSVGMGAYNMDSHNAQRYVVHDPAGDYVRNEGDVQVGVPPYSISYRAITPKLDECDNLLVPVCLSASHIAYGSIRMEPVFMVLGQSAATAACLAIDDDRSVQAVEYPRLRARLLADGQVLEYDPPSGTGRAARPGINPASLKGIIIDDDAAQRVGFDLTSTSVAPWVGGGYRHDNHERKGEQSAVFTARIDRTGRYEVRLAYSPHGNRATNVPVTIRHAGGEATTLVNQRNAPSIDGAFVSLGTFAFDRGGLATVTITNRDTDGHVIIDAVQWVAVE